MAKKVIRDIKMSSAEKPIKVIGELKGATKRSKHMIDLSMENVSEGITKEKEMNDVMGKEGEENVTYIVRDYKVPIWTRLSWIGVFGLIIIMLVNTVGTVGKGKRIATSVTRGATSGFQQLIEGAGDVSAMKINEAENMFVGAQKQFGEALNQIWFLRKDEKLSRITSILDAGTYLAQAGKLFTEIAQEFEGVFDQFIEQSDELVAHLDATQPKLDELVRQVHSAHEALERVEVRIIPKQYKDTFEKGKAQLIEAKRLLENIQAMLPGALNLLGNDSEQEILVLLQNSDEVRPTGGFIGSYLLVTLENGALTSMDLQDVYDIDDTFELELDPPPEIKKITGRWFFRDANSSPHFPVSGENALHLYELETGKRLNTVIAVRHDLLGRMLEALGPIDHPELEHPITAENYKYILTYIIESKFEGYDDPKKILKQFAPLFQERLFTTKESKEIQQILLEEMVKKNILGFSRESDIQKMFQVLGIDGAMHRPVGKTDYLQIAATSIGGNKSDGNMEQEVSHSTFVESNGDVVDEITIKRAHLWSAEEFQKWKNALEPFGYSDFPLHLKGIIGQGDNVVAMRVYVPDGAQLLTVDGLEMDKVSTMTDKDLAATYFSFDFHTQSGSEKKITLRYLLPFTVEEGVTAQYNFFAEKQPGGQPYTLWKKVIGNEFLRPLRNFPDEFRPDEKGIMNAKTQVEKGVRFSVLWGGRE